MKNPSSVSRSHFNGHLSAIIKTDTDLSANSSYQPIYQSASNIKYACVQVHSVESVNMSPVERTAAWVLNNGQYEEEKEEGQSKKESKHVEKVPINASREKTGPKKCFFFKFTYAT